MVVSTSGPPTGIGGDAERDLSITAGALLLDLDGVLVDSEAAVMRHWTELARREQLEPRVVFELAHGRRGDDAIRELVGPARMETVSAWFTELEVADTGDVSPLPGAAELLASLAGLPWAIVTSCGLDLARARLRAAGLGAPARERLISADDVSAGKPDPQGYLLAARRLELPPAEVIVIEDAPAGVDAARRAGMRCLALATTQAPTQLAAAQWVVSDLSTVSVQAIADGVGVRFRCRRAARG